MGMRYNLPMFSMIVCTLCAVVMTMGKMAYQERYTELPDDIDENTPTQDPIYTPNNGNCNSFMVPIDLKYRGRSFVPAQFKGPFALEHFVTEIMSRDSGGVHGVLGKEKDFAGQYQIAATHCIPNGTNTTHKDTVIVATHGLGLAREYWNSKWKPDEYNFVQYALARGYSVYFYDRLGCGISSKINGFEAQLNTGVAVLESLIFSLRETWTGSNNPKPSKIVLLGFGFGSYINHAAVAGNPDLADAVIHTGIGMNATSLSSINTIGSLVPRIANVEDYLRFGTYDSGYITWSSIFDQVVNFFRHPMYNPAAVDYIEKEKEAFAITELLTYFSVINMSAERFKKPVLVINGEKDYVICGGHCPGIFEEPMWMLYQNAILRIHLLKGVGHNINFSANNTGAWNEIMSFLADRKL